MADPSASVSPQLLHHLHAMCIMKYPLYQSIQPELLVDMLLKTPAVVQQYPFTWTMIEPPPPGTLMLSWHPPQMLNSCASDGYVWADAESVHTVDVKGYTVEIYYHKAGFNPNPNLQTHALYSRRCYRLKPQSPTTPSETHNLWLIHYLTAERQNQTPIASINITQAARQSFSARSYIAQLFATGQLPRKEFYLHDRNSWPVIALPNQHQQHQQQVQHMQGIPMQLQQGIAQVPPQTPQQNRHISPMGPRSTPQPNQVPGGGGVPPGYYTPARGPAAKGSGPVPPSAKRLKPTPPGNHPGVASAAAQAAALGVGGDPGMTIDEEEDTSRGDMLDHLSPREIATTRYIQHHEWMEEVLGSVYSISRIKPVDLGLGLRGELESVTKGLLELPVYPSPKPRTGENTEEKEEKDQKAILEQFKPRVEKKIQDIEDEIKRMEMLHRARLQKISKSGVCKDAEKKLRSGLGFLPSPEPSQSQTPDTEKPVDPLLLQIQSADLSTSTITKSIEEIVAEVEAAIGKKVVEKQMFHKWDLPVEEVVKMGGVVAEGNGNMDTIMGSEEDGVLGGSDQGGNEGDEYVNLDLSIGIPESGDGGDNDGPLIVGGGFQHEGDMEGEIGVDTIMDDFMNVDSKSDTPSADVEKKEGVEEQGVGDEGFSFGSTPTAGEGDKDGGIAGLGEVVEGIPGLELMEGENVGAGL